MASQVAGPRFPVLLPTNVDTLAASRVAAMRLHNPFANQFHPFRIQELGEGSLEMSRLQNA